MMNRFLISFYLLRIIILTSYCKGQEGYRYTRPIGKAFFSTSNQHMMNNNRKKINTDVFLPNYTSNRYQYEISYHTLNETIPNQLSQIVRYTRPAIQSWKWNSTTVNPFFGIPPPSSTKPFFNSETFRSNIIPSSFTAKDRPNLDAGKSTLRPSNSASTAELVESNGDYASQLESSAPNYPKPNLSKIPTTKFSCDSQKHSGYFADVETHCQVFHICTNGLKYDFLCPNETVFDQRYFICTRWNRFACDTAESLYDLKENLFDEDEAGSLIAHAAGATGAQGPSAIYIPLAKAFPASLVNSDSHIESKKPFVSLKQSTEVSKCFKVNDELDNDRDPSDGNNISYNRHLSPTNTKELSTDNQLAPRGAQLNLSDSISGLHISTTSEPIAVVPFFISSSKTTVGSEVPNSNHEPVFSLHGQLITYRTPFEPEKSPNFIHSYGHHEPTNNLRSSPRPPKLVTPYEPSFQIEGSVHRFETLTDNREMTFNSQSVFDQLHRSHTHSRHSSSFPTAGDERAHNGPGYNN